MDDRKCVIGEFRSSSVLGRLKENLIDLGFEDSAISIIRGEEFKIRHDAGTLGPLRGVEPNTFRSRLIHLGFSTSLARRFEDSIREDGSLIAVLVEEDHLQDIFDMLYNFGAESVEVAEGM